jgi:excisionase family DNA binding protein
MVSFITNHLPVSPAAELTGYSEQYLRRMLREGKIIGIKIGQVWLIDMACLQAYLDHATDAIDRRFGPQ